MNLFEPGKHSYKEWFEFSKKEQRGVIALLVCIAVLIVFRVVLILQPAHEPVNGSEYFEVIQWANADKQIEIESENKSGASKSRNFPACFSFDPNSCDINTWQKLGLTEKQAAVILKYVEKGGQFRSAVDLEKIYAIPDGFVEHVAGCVDVPQKNYVFDNGYDKKVSMSGYQKDNGSNLFIPVLVEINSADTLELRRIPGIGPYFARKIFNFRQKLGGFYDVSQLLDVYRMTASKLDSIKDYIRIDTALVRKLNVNEVDLATLSLHPYITKREASALISYRDKHGAFGHINDILHCKAIDENSFQKLRNYLEVP